MQYSESCIILIYLDSYGKKDWTICHIQLYNNSIDELLYKIRSHNWVVVSIKFVKLRKKRRKIYEKAIQFLHGFPG